MAAPVRAPRRLIPRTRGGAAWAGLAERWPRSPATWAIAGVALTLILRAPWVGAALGRDEGGLALVAEWWDRPGAHVYGDYFVDRPPLLVGVFALGVEIAGPHGVRALGALAAAVTVAAVTILAVLVAGRPAAPWAASVSALLASSVLLGAVFTPSELLACVPASLSVLALAAGVTGRHGGHWAFALSGALAAGALLVKQSFGGALIAGAAALAAVALTDRDARRRVAAASAAWAGGVAAVGAGLAAWAAIAGVPLGALEYALVGFRIDALDAPWTRDLAHRASRLLLPLAATGFALALACAVAGIAGIRDRPELRAGLAAWLLGGLAGIALGGSYWPHYLIALVPVTAVGAAAAFVRRPRLGRGVVATMALLGLAVAVGAVVRGEPQRYQRDVVRTAEHVRSRAFRADTIYVMYARANLLYYSGLRPASAYHWSLMMQAAPGAEEDLRRLLATPGRPTWIVEEQPGWAFFLDRDGATRRAIAANYRPAGVVCGRRILLARGLDRPPAPIPRDCAAGPGI